MGSGGHIATVARVDVTETDVATTAPDPADRNLRQRLRATSATVGRGVAGLPDRLPDNVREQVGISVKRLKKVRTPKGFKKAVLEEVERLFLAVTPLLAAAPLPLTGWRARLAAGAAGSASAVVEQAEEVAALVSWGGALPSAPVVTGAVLAGWILELWIAVSARVNQLKAAGRQVDPDTLSRELAGAYLDDREGAKNNDMAWAVRSVAVRAAKRWVAGLIPGFGIAYDGVSSQRTVSRILAEPLDAHPLLPALGPA
jgi:hypothetical protein